MDIKEESDKIPFMLMEQIGINEQLKEELDKKDKRLKRQERLITKRDKEIAELKEDNSKQWEERCRLTFKLQEAEERLSQIELQILEED